MQHKMQNSATAPAPKNTKIGDAKLKLGDEVDFVVRHSLDKSLHQ